MTMAALAMRAIVERLRARGRLRKVEVAGCVRGSVGVVGAIDAIIGWHLIAESNRQSSRMASGVQ